MPQSDALLSGINLESDTPFLQVFKKHERDVPTLLKACTQLIERYQATPQILFQKLNALDENNLSILDHIKLLRLRGIPCESALMTAYAQLERLLREKGALHFIDAERFAQSRQRKNTPEESIPDAAVRTFVQDKQNTHDTELNQASTDAIIALKQRYGVAPDPTPQLKEIESYLEKLAQSNDLKQKEIGEKARVAFRNFQGISEKREGLSLSDLMALIWKGINDTTPEALPAGISMVSQEDKHSRKVGLADALVFSQQICFMGKTNDILGALNGIHKDVPALLTKAMLKAQIANSTLTLIATALREKTPSEQRAILRDWDNSDGVADAFRESLMNLANKKGHIQETLENEYLPMAGRLIKKDEIQSVIDTNVQVLEFAPRPSVYRPLSDLVEKISELTLPENTNETVKTQLKVLKKAIDANVLFATDESYETSYERIKTEFQALHAAVMPQLSGALRSCFFGDLSVEISAKNVNKAGPFGVTPLHLAVQSGDKAKVKTLLEMGASVETNDFNDNTPLHYAATLGHVEIFKLLMHQALKTVNKDKKAGDEAQINLLTRKNQDGESPFTLAIQQGNEKVITESVSALTFSALLKDKQTTRRALFNALHHQQIPWLKRLLKDNQVDPNADIYPVNSNYATPLMCAAAQGDVEVLNILLAHQRIDPNAGYRIIERYQADYVPSSALESAVTAKKPEAVQRLLQHPNISLQKRDAAGWTPMHYATMSDDVQCLVELLNHPNAAATLLMKARNGETPLEGAVLEGNVKAVKQIVAYLASLPESKEAYMKLSGNRNDGCKTALAAAVNGGMPEMVKALLPMHSKKEIQAAFGAVIALKRADLVPLFLQDGNVDLLPPISSFSLFGRNRPLYLHSAVENADLKTVQALFDNMDPQYFSEVLAARNAAGKTVFELAREKGAVAILAEFAKQMKRLQETKKMSVRLPELEELAPKRMGFSTGFVNAGSGKLLPVSPHNSQPDVSTIYKTGIKPLHHA